MNRKEIGKSIWKSKLRPSENGAWFPEFRGGSFFGDKILLAEKKGDICVNQDAPGRIMLP